MFYCRVLRIVLMTGVGNDVNKPVNHDKRAALSVLLERSAKLLYEFRESCRLLGAVRLYRLLLFEK
jgi:hypothetical protein